MPNRFLLLIDPLLGPIRSPVRYRQLLAERFDGPSERLCRRDDSGGDVAGDIGRRRWACRPGTGDTDSLSGVTTIALVSANRGCVIGMTSGATSPVTALLFAVLTSAERGTVTRTTPSLPTCRPQ